MQQIHCIDNQCNVGRVLAERICNLQVRNNRITIQNVLPTFQKIIRKVAINPLEAGLADFRQFNKQALGDLRRGVIRIDQDRQRFVGHSICHAGVTNGKIWRACGEQPIGALFL